MEQGTEELLKFGGFRLNVEGHKQVRRKTFPQRAIERKPKLNTRFSGVSGYCFDTVKRFPVVSHIIIIRFFLATLRNATRGLTKLR
jgi:hypothetical protein